MTAGFKETVEEELERLRAADSYKKQVISELLDRYKEKDAVLLECAKMLDELGFPVAADKAYLAVDITYRRKDAHKS